MPPDPPALSYAAGSFWAKEGAATKILPARGSASFTVTSAAEPAPPTAPPAEEKPTVRPAGVPAAPKITSENCPDSDKWCSAVTPKFVWSLPTGTTAARLLVGKLPEAVPYVNYTPAISSKELVDLEDGVWYFHVQLANKVGWGDVAHYRFQLDRVKPSRLSLSEVQREDPTEPEVQFNISAEDALSGIDFYELRINGKEAGNWRDDGSHLYTLPRLKSGQYTLSVKVFDKAGNWLEDSKDFVIEVKEARAPLAELKAPREFTVYSPMFYLITMLWALLLIVLYFLVRWLIKKIILLRKKRCVENREADQILLQARMLEKKIGQLVKIWKQIKKTKHLTREEKQCLVRFRGDLNEVELSIQNGLRILKKK